MAPDPGPSGYLFLDVDGVLNPEAWTLGGDWRVTDVGEQEIWMSDELSQWLRSLVERGIEIVWATTWIEIPDDLSALAALLQLPLDLPRIDRIEWGPGEGDECGKRPGVGMWLAHHTIDPRATPVAWVDDLLGTRDHEWAEELGIRAIKVPPTPGLSDPQQRARIERALGLVAAAPETSPTARKDPHHG